jgi:hypothetical protein
MGGVLGNLGEHERPALTGEGLRYFESALERGNRVVGLGGHFFKVDQSSQITVPLSNKETLGQKDLSVLMRASPLPFRPLPAASLTTEVTPWRHLPPVQRQCVIAARLGAVGIFSQVVCDAPAGRRAEFG